MANIILKFNNQTYEIDESQFQPAAITFAQFLTETLEGTGATIILGNTSYQIDKTKLTAAAQELTQHLEAAAGDDIKTNVNGTDYLLDADRLQEATAQMTLTCGRLASALPIQYEELYISPNGIPAIGATQAAFCLHSDGTFDTVIVGPASNLLLEDIDVEVCGVSHGTYTFNDNTITMNIEMYGEPAVVEGMFSADGQTIEIPAFGITGVTGQDNIYIDNNIVYYYNEKLEGYSAVLFNPKKIAAVINDIVNGYPVVALGTNIYMENDDLTLLLCASSIKEIGFQACAWCHELKIVGSNDALEVIQDRAFYDCINLEQVSIGANVRYIGAWALDGCTSLTNIRYHNTMEAWNAIEKGENWCDVALQTIECEDGTITL